MSLTHLKHIEIYANLIITSGVNIQKGEKLLIEASFASYEFARLLAETAYQRGAAYVRINVKDNYLTRSKIESSPKEYLDYTPSYLESQYESMISEGWCRIRIDNTSEINVMSGVNSDDYQKFEKAWALKAKKYHKTVISNQVSWCVICFPDPIWAGKILKKTPSLEAQKELWDIMIPLLRLDTSDPIKTWKEHTQSLEKRCEYLNSLQGKLIHFEDKEIGTDLKLWLCEDAIWIAGSEKTQSGKPFIANLPTEEVFSAPHSHKAEGKVFITRPVRIMETQVEGAWFEFKEGKAVNWGAKNHKELIDKLLSMDDNASRLGEVALVDKNSPIYQSQRIFSSILYDENASCHIAFGSAYPNCSKGGNSLDTQSLSSKGINDSLIHRDFMIGSDNMNVKLLDAQNKWHSIIEKGKFVV